jgi:REP element-mobilizing transposase RayT
VHHVTSRGNEKESVVRDDQDRETFLSTLLRVNKHYNWVRHAYCLVDNHYYLLIETPDGNLSVGTRQLNGVYTQAFNKQHNRTGHFLQGRYKAILVQKESHLLEVCWYVVLSRNRAHTEESPGGWKWSSYHAMAGKEKPHPCLTTDWVLRQFSGERVNAEKDAAGS